MFLYYTGSVDINPKEVVSVGLRGDICCHQTLQINREEAEMVVRLLDAEFGPGSGINRDEIYNPGVCRLWFTVEPLSPTGVFCPKIWINPCDPRAKNRKIRNIIRTVFQPQTVWNYLELPDLATINKLVNAMEPESGWCVVVMDDRMLVKSKIGRIKYELFEIVESEKGWLTQNPLWSMLLVISKEARRWRAMAEPSDHSLHLIKIANALERLNRFLPHLIVFAGGKVEFD